MPPGATVIVKTQKVIVNPQTRQVAVIAAGPQGPQGAPGPGGKNDYIRADGTVPMLADLILPGDPQFDLAAATRQYVNNYAWSRALADARFVKLDGDAMVGALSINGPSSAASLSLRSTPNTPFVEWRSTDGVTRYGYYQVVPTYSRQAVDDAAGTLYFRTGSADQAKITSEGIFALVSATYPANVVAGSAVSSGARIRLHVPTSGDICYIDYAGWGAVGTEQLVFRAGTVAVLTLEDTVIRTQKPIYATGQPRFYSTSSQGLIVAANTPPYIGFYGAATNVDTLGTRSGYVGFPATAHMYLNNETANGNCYILPGTGTGATILGSANAEQARIDSGGNFLVNKTASATGTAGHELQNSGRAWHTTGTATAYCMVAVIVDGVTGNVFCDFRNGATGATRIGSITQSGTAAVAYNTSSHGPHKGNVTDLDDDEAIERVLKWRPVAYQWKLDENGQVSDIGFPQGEVEHGFIAQEMNEINPNAVTPGIGEESEHRAWMAAKVEYDLIANQRERIQSDYDILVSGMGPDDEKPPMPELPELPEKPSDMSPFRAWQGDWTKLVPDLAAAMQAVIRQNQALTARVEELERMVR